MNNVFEYKGFLGSAEISMEDAVLFGKLLYVNDLVTYEAETMHELKTAFEEAVDDYVDFCSCHGKEPEKPFKGSFNVRISPELHRKAAFEAEKQGITLNQFVQRSIEHEVDGEYISGKTNETYHAMADTVQRLNNHYVLKAAAEKAMKWPQIVGGETA